MNMPSANTRIGATANSDQTMRLATPLNLTAPNDPTANKPAGIRTDGSSFAVGVTNRMENKSHAAAQPSSRLTNGASTARMWNVEVTGLRSFFPWLPD